MVTKSVRKSSLSRIGFASQIQFWSRVLLRIWTKIVHSNNLKMDQNCNLSRDLDQICYSGEKKSLFLFVHDHVSKCSFDPLSKGSNVQFWSRFEVIIWTKIAFSNQIRHVNLTSIKRFSTPKIRLFIVPPTHRPHLTNF